MKKIKNPIDLQWYADPEARCYDGKYYIYVTRSANEYDMQPNIDMLMSEDLENWEKVTDIIDMSGFPWVKRAVWAPTIIEQNGKYYLIFASNDIQSDNEIGGLEIAVCDTPKGPFKAILDKPLIDRFINKAQPIDAHLFKDDDGTVYLYYGGWGHCNVAIMKPDMTGFLPFEDGAFFKEITPEEYTEAPCMLKKDGKYYFMWSSGNWTNETYAVNYAVCDTPFGPFVRKDKILQADGIVANGPGHHGYLKIDGTNDYLIVYHRRPVDSVEWGCRLLCLDHLYIGDGTMEKVKMTHECIIENI